METLCNSEIPKTQDSGARERARNEAGENHAVEKAGRDPLTPTPRWGTNKRFRQRDAGAWSLGCGCVCESVCSSGGEWML